MSALSLLARGRRTPAIRDPSAAQAALERVLERDDGALAELLSREPKARLLLEGALEASPYLVRLCAGDPPRLKRLLEADPARRVDELIDAACVFEAGDEAALMRALRLVKQEAALLIALADLSKAMETMEATRALTRIADATLKAAVAFTLREAALKGQLELADPRAPERGCGWIFLGMGKQGAFELNYSSDIDLVVFFDRSRVRVARPDEDVDLYVRLTKRVVKIMSEQTADGYVFRTDLRLRPDPGATPIALPLSAALSYYESMGQNWERAAFIKARPVAGDLAAGEAFLHELAPFIWRKYFDFAAIADVHSIKRQIHAAKGHGRIAVLGHNVKLGRGGVREIEFFAQTQQLIIGGRDPSLRGRGTLEMLARLAQAGWIEQEACEELSEAYCFLRDVEHRIQMVADEQKHTLPETPAGLAVIAALMDFPSGEAFSQALLRRFDCVQQRYARLFESSPQLSAGGNLVFTGDADDPETLETLSRLGYRHPQIITETVRAWHFGRYAATRSTIARERLTELTPALLEALAATDNGDAAFLAFDAMMRKLPAGVQLFSMLASQPRLLDLLAEILGSAPKLAETISRRPRVLGALLEPGFFSEDLDEAQLARRFDQQLREARSYEDALDRARIFGQEQKFLLGARVLTGALSVERAGDAYARLAGVVIAGLFSCVAAEFARAHGTIPGGAVAVVALGKLGGREMTAASDLDLMLLYDADPLAQSQGGARSLSSAPYYARLTQRLIAALSAPTAEGLLYEVDFRLRPSGSKGPIAVSYSAFVDYQAKEAWTWERMALTRARIVAGHGAFSDRVDVAIRTALTAPRDPEQLRRDVADMRRRLERDKPARSCFDVKQAKGGLIDVEFIAQYLMLREAARHPQALTTRTAQALRELAAIGALSESGQATLTRALTLYQRLTQLLRLSLDGDFVAREAPHGLAELLARAAGTPDLSQLEALLKDTQQEVRGLFDALLSG